MRWPPLVSCIVFTADLLDSRPHRRRWHNAQRVFESVKVRFAEIFRIFLDKLTLGVLYHFVCGEIHCVIVIPFFLLNLRHFDLGFFGSFIVQTRHPVLFERTDGDMFDHGQVMHDQGVANILSVDIKCTKNEGIFSVEF